MKSAYKGLRSKLKDGGSDYASAKPRSAPNSPTTKRKTMSDFMVPVASYKKDASLAIKNANLQRFVVITFRRHFIRDLQVVQSFKSQFAP